MQPKKAFSFLDQSAGTPMVLLDRSGNLLTPGAIVDSTGTFAFDPASLPKAYTYDADKNILTITYGPNKDGRKVRITNTWSGGLKMAESAPVLITTEAASITLGGPDGGAPGVPSGDFTVSVEPAGAAFTPFTYKPSSPDGKFTPESVDLSFSAPSATFKFTPYNEGVLRISGTTDAALALPQALSFDCTIPRVTAPKQPAKPVLTALVGAISIAYNLPADGGSAIIAGEFTDSNGVITALTASPQTIPKAAGAAIAGAIRFQNAKGWSQASPQADAVTPLAAVPTLVEGFLAKSDFTPAANVTLNQSSGWVVPGTASLDIVGAATNATATASKTLPGTVNPASFRKMALALNVIDATNMNGVGMNIGKSPNSNQILLSGWPNGTGVAANQKHRSGKRWLAWDMATDMKLASGAGAQTGVQIKAMVTQAAPGGARVQFGALMADVGSMGKVLIGLDDQYGDQYTVAAPIARRYGVLCNLFIARDLLGTSNHMTEAMVDDLYKNYNWSMCTDSMADDSVVNLNDIPSAINGSIGAVANRAYIRSKGWTGAEDALCYTFGVWSEAYCQALEAAGFVLARTTEPEVMHTRFGRTDSWMTFPGIGMGGKSLDYLIGYLNLCEYRGVTGLFYAHHVLPDDQADANAVKQSVWDAFCAEVALRRDAGRIENPNMAQFLASDLNASPPTL